MKTFSDFLNESASAVVYHYTSVWNAEKIVTQKKFALTPAVGTASEQDKGVKGKPYFMSLTRMKEGDYTRASLGSGSGVVFEMNGSYLNNNHTTKPVDYWDQWWVKQNAAGDKDRGREAEDRLYSKEMFLHLPDDPTKMIKSVHVLDVKRENPDKMDQRRDGISNNQIRTLAIWAKRHKIPFFLYDNKKDFLLQNRKNAVKLTHEFIATKLAGHKPKDVSDRPDRDYLEGWRELWWKNKRSHLSDRGKRALNSALRNEYQSLASDIHNDKSGGKESIRKMMNIFKWAKVSSPKEYVMKMWEKWKDVPYD